MTPDDLWQREYDRWLAKCAKKRARYAWRMANEPGYAERCRAYSRAYRAAHREEANGYKREWMRRYRATSTSSAATTTLAPVNESGR